MSNQCAQCNKIRALPHSPTKRDMALEHIMFCVCQARPVEAPKYDPNTGHGGGVWQPKPEPAKPVEAPRGNHADHCSYWKYPMTCDCGKGFQPEPVEAPKRLSSCTHTSAICCGEDCDAVRKPEPAKPSTKALCGNCGHGHTDKCWHCGCPSWKAEPSKPPLDDEGRNWSPETRTAVEQGLAQAAAERFTAKPPEVWVCQACGDRETANRCANCGSPKPALTKPPEVSNPCGYQPIKPKSPESEALAKLRSSIIPDMAIPSDFVIRITETDWQELKRLIEADAQRLKEARDRLVAQDLSLARLDNDLANSTEEFIHMKDKLTERAEKAEENYDLLCTEHNRSAENFKKVVERAEKAERERDELIHDLARLKESETLYVNELVAVKGRLAELIYAWDYEPPSKFHAAIIDAREACAKAEAGEQMENKDIYSDQRDQIRQLRKEVKELREDRAKWVKVCAERDERIVRLRDELSVFLNLPYAAQKQAVAHRRDLVQRIKDYASQHQYPFANAIVDLCNQVLRA